MPRIPVLPPDVLKKVDQKVGIIQIITGKTALNEDFFAYVSVKPSLYEEFARKAKAGERIDVETFGKVLHKGFGTEPSDDVKEYMREKYGIDPNFGDKLEEAIEDILQKQNPTQK